VDLPTAGLPKIPSFPIPLPAFCFWSRDQALQHFTKPSASNFSNLQREALGRCMWWRHVFKKKTVYEFEAQAETKIKHEMGML